MREPPSGFTRKKHRSTLSAVKDGPCKGPLAKVLDGGEMEGRMRNPEGAEQKPPGINHPAQNS